MALLDEAQKKVATTAAPAPAPKAPATTAAPTAAPKPPTTTAAPKPAATPAPAPASVPSAYSKVANQSSTSATTTAFDESKGVAGRVDDIVSSGSPLMDLARTQAAQDANAMGLRRSSMAVGAAQDAVMRAAVPIASADAQAYQTQQLANQDAKNTVAIKNADRAADIRLKGLEADTRRMLTQMEGDNRVKLTEMEAAYRQQIGANENVANAWGTMLQEIGKIQANPDMTQYSRKVYIENMLNAFKSYAGFWGAQSDIDVDGLLDFGVSPETGVPNKPGTQTIGKLPVPTTPAPAPGTPSPDIGGA